MRIDKCSSLQALVLLQRAEAEHGLALPEVASLAAQVEVIALPRGAAAFEAGRPCPHLFVVREGLFKQVYTRPDGSEWIKSFAGPGQLFACPAALEGQRPASFASVAMEPGVVERVPFAALERLAEAHAGWQKLLRLGFQRLAELKVRRELDLLTLPAAALHDQWLREQPALAARVPQKDLASYIGVTPQSLNRILRQRRRNAAT